VIEETWHAKSPIAAGLLFLVTVALVSGCSSEVVVPTLVSMELAEEEDEQTEAIIIFLGFMNLTDPCEFSIDISFAGDVSEFRHDGGSLPSGYDIVNQQIEVEVDGTLTTSVVGRLRGPSVGSGSWTAEISAIGSDERELSRRALTLSCAESS